jgi:hypothetical protein
MTIAALALALGGMLAATASPASALTTCTGGVAPSLSTNSSVYSVGQAPEYIVNGPAFCSLYWSSWRFNTSTGQWVSTGEVDDFYGQATNSNGTVSPALVGNPWTSSDGGLWIKQVRFGAPPDGPTVSVEFQVIVD